MSLLYPYPVSVKTTKRCQFGIPGKRYDCRCIGKYLLNGKCYCALHYDTVWKVTNPVYGTQHEWNLDDLRWREFVPHCVRCGVIRVYEGLPQLPCRGKMPEIILSGILFRSNNVLPMGDDPGTGSVRA